MHANYGVTLPVAYNDYKPRNILSLAERVKVIHEYNKPLIRPSLQQLAKKFDCSSKQIKNILLNRNAILDSYNGGVTKKPANDSMQQKQEKIVFLDKAMYEYIQRALYFNYSINDHKFRRKALQIKQSIGLDEFQPTQAWMDEFKKTYGIPGFDLHSLRNNLHIKEIKRPRLDAIDIVQHVSDMKQEYQIDVNRRSASRNEKHCNISSPGPEVIIGIDDEEDEELQNLNVCTPTPPPEQTAFSTTIQNITPKRRVSSPFPDIESVDGALKHLKALEEYAMLQDNFRAIGLLTQLEQIFQKCDKNY